jgi:hypothetical protein
MSDTANEDGQGPTPEFGSCCAHLKEAMSGADFEPLINTGEDGVLYLSVGLIDLEGEEPGIVDHPLYFCPFCGTRVQSVEEVEAKSGGDEEQASE